MGSGGTGTGSKSNSYQRRLEHSWYTSFENEHRLYHHVRKPLQEVCVVCAIGVNIIVCVVLIQGYSWMHVRS